MKHELTDEQLEEVKTWKPEWFKPVYKDNTWYKHTKHNSIMFNVKNGYGYGINHYGVWIKDAAWLANYLENGRWREATNEEIEESLTNESKKCYEIGDLVECIRNDYAGGKRVIDNFEKASFENNKLYLENTRGYMICVFEDGKWAQVITPASDIHTDIQALKDKYTDYNLTIIAEKK